MLNKLGGMQEESAAFYLYSPAIGMYLKYESPVQVFLDSGFQTRYLMGIFNYSKLSPTAFETFSIIVEA